MQTQTPFTEDTSPRENPGQIMLTSRGLRLADLDMCVFLWKVLIIYYFHNGRWNVDASLFCLDRALDFTGQGRGVICDSGKHTYSKLMY